MNKPALAKMPSMIGKYQVKAVLGRGGMGIVYRGLDPRLGREVAIKTLTEDFSDKPEMLQRFYIEAGRTGRFRHPNIVVVFDAGDQDGKPYLVMEYIEGESLEAVIKGHKQLPLELRLSFVEQVCMALAYAHREGVVHRDVKPANVIVQRDGTAKLVDFGIARAEPENMDHSLTSTGSLIGTPAYMAPERLQGKPIDGRSDVFSVGILLYHLITYRLPFEAEFPSIIELILRHEPTPPSTLATDCPVSLDAIVGRALAKDPANRYASADEMASDLLGVIDVIKGARVSELMSEARVALAQGAYVGARDTVKQLLRLDPKNQEAKRLLASVEQQITVKENERKARDLGRLAQQALDNKEWSKALDLCDQGLSILPTGQTLLDLRQAVISSKKTHEQISQLLVRTASAREKGDLEHAKSHAQTALQLDPQNSQIIALCKILEEEIREKQCHYELQQLLDRARGLLDDGELDAALATLAEADALSPNDPEIIPLRDKVTSIISEKQLRALIGRFEEQLPTATTLDRLVSISTDLEDALREHPVDPGLLRLKLQIGPRVRQLENEALVRDLIQLAGVLPAEEGLSRVREGLVRVPGHLRLLSLERALSERLNEQSRRQSLSKHLTAARKAIEERLYLEAVNILKRCKSEGHTSPEIESLLNLAQTSASEHISQELIERTYAQVQLMMDQDDYTGAVDVVQRAIQQVDDPIFHRLLDEASDRQAASERRALAIVAEAESLVQLGLTFEALHLVTAESAGLQRLSHFKVAKSRIESLASRESQFREQFGRAYAALGDPKLLKEVTSALAAEHRSIGCPWIAAAQGRLRVRVEAIARERVIAALQSAQADLAVDDGEGAHSSISAAQPWTEFVGLKLKDEFRQMSEEVARARKVLRFRHAFRR